MKSGGKTAPMSIIAGGAVALRDAKGATARATVNNNFAVARTEVTLADYRRFVGASGYRGGAQGCNNIEGFAMFVAKDRTWQKPGFEQSERAPVVCVDYSDATAYARWLSKETGESYRLLSEAEWQLLAKAAPAPGCKTGNLGDMDFGKQFDSRKIYGCSDKFAATTAVGSFGTDRNGLMDLTGNVREWVADCWNASIAGHPAGGGAWQSGRCSSRIAMGTAWVSGPAETSAIARTAFDSDARNNTVGFRVARDIAQSQ
jgi:formylglycine-generating enzyme required for sulfatase activity